MNTTTGTAKLLRTSLRTDSWGTGIFGVVMLIAGPWLSDPLGLPSDWFVPLGIAMLGGAVALGLIAGYPKIPTRLALSAVIGNALCGVAIIAIVAAGILPLTGLGIAFIVVGWLWVVGFAGLEYAGLRRP